MLHLHYPLQTPASLDDVYAHTDPRFQTDTRHAIANKANQVWNGMQCAPETWTELLVHRSDEPFFFIFSKGTEKEELHRALPKDMFIERVDDSVRKYGSYEKDVNNMDCLFHYTPGTYHLILCGLRGTVPEQRSGFPRMGLGKALHLTLRHIGLPEIGVNANGDLLIDNRMFGKIHIVHISNTLRYEEMYLIEQYDEQMFDEVLMRPHLMDKLCRGAANIERTVTGLTGLNRELPGFNRDRFWSTILSLIIEGDYA